MKLTQYHTASMQHTHTTLPLCSSPILHCIHAARTVSRCLHAAHTVLRCTLAAYTSHAASTQLTHPMLHPCSSHSTMLHPCSSHITAVHSCSSHIPRCIHAAHTVRYLIHAAHTSLIPFGLLLYPQVQPELGTFPTSLHPNSECPPASQHSFSEPLITEAWLAQSCHIPRCRHDELAMA